MRWSWERATSSGGGEVLAPGKTWAWTWLESCWTPISLKRASEGTEGISRYT